MKKTSTLKNVTESSKKKGFLDSEIKFFYLKDKNLSDISLHYHDFHKILILLHGNLNYQIEGTELSLKENDIVIVPAGSLHRPILKPCDYYERLIIYVSYSYLKASSDSSIDLDESLKAIARTNTYCLRSTRIPGTLIQAIINKLVEESMKNNKGSEIYKKLLLTELIIEASRLKDFLAAPDDAADEASNKIPQVIQYINAHLTEELSVDSISKELFISRYYLMHSFKEKTGYTIGSFITAKRIYLADQLIATGMPMTKVAFECGYNSYSTFFRAYKKLHKPGVEPSQEL